MSSETLTVTSGAAGLRSLVGRANDMDQTATVRLRRLEQDVIDVFVTTPFEVIASRRINGYLSRDGAVVAASDLLKALEAGSKEIGEDRDANWPGALPPSTGFQILDNIPVTIVRELADEGQKLTREFSGPMGPPASLLDQTVVTVEHEGTTVEIPMRMIFTCTSLGLIPGFAAPIEVPRHLRVSAAGRWVRVDAPFGTVYRSTGLGNVLAL